MTFKDYFSGHAAEYATYRPRYPAALFVWLAQQCEQRDRGWDCATGNGQAAIALADHFQQVMATDASAEQLQQAPAHPQVTYRVALAATSGLDAHSLDLVTVAQAVHWFDLETFYREVKRVLKPRGGVRNLVLWPTAFGLFHPGSSLNPLLQPHPGRLLDPRTTAGRNRLSHPAVSL